MRGTNKFILEITEAEADTIAKFYDEILNCPIPLNDKDILNVIKTIYNNEKVVDEIANDELIISYVESEE